MTPEEIHPNCKVSLETGFLRLTLKAADPCVTVEPSAIHEVGSVYARMTSCNLIS